MSIQIKKQRYEVYFFVPLICLCSYFCYTSLSFHLHDFSNSYFPALLVKEGIPPASVLFDIYSFNQYIHSQGYPEILADFYLNSPFLSTAFLPLTYIEDAHLAKNIFNVFSIICFIFSLGLLHQLYAKNHSWFILLIPLFFFIPLRNHILFGQLYFIVLAAMLPAYWAIQHGKEWLAALGISIAFLLKIFPVIMGLPLLFQQRWRLIGKAIVVTLALFAISIWVSGSEFWRVYLTEIWPQAIQNNSTVGFATRSQSFDALVKTIFVYDAYYNPNALIDLPRLYTFGITIYKAIILGLALQLSWAYRDRLLRILAIWTVAFMLLQSRSASYAQVLWIIPAFEFLDSAERRRGKFLFLGLLLLLCNFPIHWLADSPIILRFLRLWLFWALGGCFFYLFRSEIQQRSLTVLVLFLAIFLWSIASPPKEDQAGYVLAEKNYFMIMDYGQQDGLLAYTAMGRKIEEVKTSIPIHSFDTTACSIREGQIYYQGKQMTFDPGLKKKPVLINDLEIYFLSDFHSRRGVFTLKKIPL